MEWIAELVAKLTGGVFWDMATEAFLTTISWVFGLLPSEVREFWEDTYISQIIELFSGGGQPNGTFQQGLVFGYDIFTWFIPLQALVAQWFIILLILGAIRTSRWIVGLIPTWIVGS